MAEYYIVEKIPDEQAQEILQQLKDAEIKAERNNSGGLNIEPTNEQVNKMQDICHDFRLRHHEGEPEINILEIDSR